MSIIEQQLSLKERSEIENRLSNYHIPLQILQIVAEECNCGEIVSGSEVRGKSKTLSLISKLNDRALIQLRQIFLDCKDAFSSFRFAVLLSSKFTTFSYKFVLAKKVRGKSSHEYTIDVCIFNRSTEDMVAVGIQNNDREGKAADAKSLLKFLSAIRDLSAVNPNLRSAYYSSSYGYDCDLSSIVAKGLNARKGIDIEIDFLEFQDGVYRQIKG